MLMFVLVVMIKVLVCVSVLMVDVMRVVGSDVVVVVELVGLENGMMEKWWCWMLCEWCCDYMLVWVLCSIDLVIVWCCVCMVIGNVIVGCL